MAEYAVISVGVKAIEPGYYGVEDKVKEVSNYLYGRSFFLAAEQSIVPDLYSLVFVVEERYVDMIIPRLASGLFAARREDAIDFFS